MVKVIAKPANGLARVIAPFLNSSLTTVQLRSNLAAVILIALTGLVRATAPADSGTGTVDFRYAPPEWQTAICLPDEPHKSLVDRSGELLYHYGKGANENSPRASAWKWRAAQCGRSRSCFRRARPSCGR